jgi:hypothetical protein
MLDKSRFERYENMWLEISTNPELRTFIWDRLAEQQEMEDGASPRAKL